MFRPRDQLADLIAAERHESGFTFGMFRRTSTSFQYTEHGSFRGRFDDTVQMIENAARECVGSRYQALDVGDICVYEVLLISQTFVPPGADAIQPQISYAEAYNAPLGNMANLDPDSEKLRTSAVRLSPTHKLWEIDSKVLIVVFGGYNRANPPSR